MSYRGAISKTISLKNEYINLKKETYKFNSATKNLALLIQQKSYYDSILKKYQINKGSLQTNLLKTINSTCDSTDLKIINFFEPHIIRLKNLKISTYQFTVKGDYKTIIQLIYIIEQKTKFGEIISLNFEKKTNFKTGKTYLQAQILLRNFR
ncbi:hypothetical protein ICJ83_11835 [Aestuariibaculum sp. TT11]|uniref:Uncharacterized protein n=1 Tax=Aestuariibaculum sediminum TaxID=2770637 RepID=A0A8J6Q3X2_9FLAO|nr:hypothetical protein [Aestuariibaculum sediminum]